ncbi:MAG: winged helix-turn-helix transcriptional regulator [Acidimicrobiales bacterium]
MGASTDFGTMRCSIARSFAVMGDPWKALVVRDLHVGLTRFDQLVADLGVSRKVLTQRLQELVDDGLVERRAYQQRPLRHDYLLTEQGRDLVPIILAVLAWGDRWLAGDAGPPAITYHHGHPIEVAVVCAHCGEPVQAEGVSAGPGPGGGPGPGTRLIGQRLSDH